MTQEEVLLIKRTWKLFREIDPGLVGDIFYSRLFFSNPSLRKMFPKEMSLQYLKLVDMLNMLVGGLDDLHHLSSEIEEMALRHVGFGVKPTHYKLVGDALLWTLEQGLAEDFTPSVKNAWIKCFNTLAGSMIQASPY